MSFPTAFAVTPRCQLSYDNLYMGKFIVYVEKPMRQFAIVPAAGNSSRMGTDKLILPWRGKALISHLIEAWQMSDVDAVVATIRPGDVELRKTLETHEIEIVQPSSAPVDMKASVQLGLQHLATHWQPTDDDIWMLAPADMPRLHPQIIRDVVAGYTANHPRIVVPTYKGRRGHPVLFPWRDAVRVFELGAHEGVNTLTRDASVQEVQLTDRSCLQDVDFPEDYCDLMQD